MSTSSVRRADRKGNSLIREALKQGPLAVGSKGAAVKAVERMLDQAGFDIGKADDVFDDRTARALARFEQSTGVRTGPDGLPAMPDGVFDAASFDKLKGVQERLRVHAKPFFGAGQASPRIAETQRQLKKLGYDPGRTDGVYDAQTGKAVAAFKKDQRINGDSQFLGKRSLEAARQESKALDHGAWRGRYNQKNAKPHRRLDAATGQAASKPGPGGAEGIGAGSPRRVVKNVQAHLKAAGYDPKRADGVFDERTEAALQAFQRRAKDPQLPVTGRADAATWKQLQRSMFAAKNGTSPAQAVGEKSSAVARSEKILKQLGYKGVKVDGVFDRATQKASRKFEKRFRGMGSDGQIGAGQLERMKQVLRAKKNPGSGPTVKKGYSGRPVRQLEARLKKYGFNPGKVDGKFGKQTARAVRKFQRAFGLKADGVAGKKTWRMLGVKATGSVTAPGKRVTAYVNGRGFPITVTSAGGSEYMRSDAAKSFKRMVEAARRAGISLSATSGFRSMAEQRQLYQMWLNGTGNRAAPPGFSNHQNGIAMDVGGVGAFGSAAYNWLARNAGRFGFNNVEGRGVDEPWHWVYAR